MRHALTAFPIFALALAFAVFSQDKPSMAQGGHDSMQQMMAGGAAKGACMPGHEGMGFMKEGMMRGPQECRANFGPGGCCMQQGNFPSRHHRLFLACIAIMLLLALVNILLTILVCMDMAKMAAFNAIWIPIVLIIGIPGTGLYALFRIGDMVKTAGANK